MDKIDLAKIDKAYYTAKTAPHIVELKEIQYISILGKGDPSQSDFSDRIQALYATAYAIKFLHKAKDKDYVVPKLEALWWYDEAKFPDVSIEESPRIPRSEWEYRLLLRLPDFVKEREVKEMTAHVLEKKKILLAEEVTYFKLKEGKVVQMLHVGPFDKEPESLLRIAAFTKKEGLLRNGLHHEIYLSDFRKTAPEKLKTILREPVK